MKEKKEKEEEEDLTGSLWSVKGEKELPARSSGL